MPAPSFSNTYANNWPDELLRSLAISVLSGQNPDGSPFSLPIGNGTHPQSFAQLISTGNNKHDYARRILASLISGQNPDGTPFSLPVGISPGPSYSDPLTVDITGSDPTFMTVKSGVFVAASSTVDFEIPLSLLAYGNSQVNFNLLYGAVSPETPQSLRTTGRYSPPAAGVTVKRLGRIWWAQADTFTRVLHLTGLTPGTRYTWAIQAAVTSANEIISPPGGFSAPGSIVLQTDAVKPIPKMYVSFPTNNTVVSYYMGGRPNWNLVDQKALHQLNTSVVVGAGPQRLAITPDQARVAVVNVTDRTVTAIDTATDLPTLTTAAFAGGAIPDGIFPHPTANVSVWVACSDGKLYAVNIYTGAMSNWPVASNPLTALTNDSLNAYAVCPVDKKVYKVNLAAGTVTASPALAQTPNSIAITPDGTGLWVGSLGPTSTLVNLRTSDMTQLQSIASYVPAQNVTTLAVSPSSRILWVGQANGQVSYLTINSPDDPTNNIYDIPFMTGAVTDIKLTADHYIYVAVGSPKNYVWLWPSATWYCRALTNPDFNQEFCEPTIRGATQG